MHANIEITTAESRFCRSAVSARPEKYGAQLEPWRAWSCTTLRKPCGNPRNTTVTALAKGQRLLEDRLRFRTADRGEDSGLPLQGHDVQDFPQ